MVSELPNISDTARVSFSDAAKLLGISRPTLYKRVESGLIKSHRYKDSKWPFFYGSDIKFYYRRIAL